MRNQKRNIILIVGAILFLCLIFASHYFYLERTVFLDIAFHLFHIIQEGDYAIQNNRFGSVFTQSFPLICSNLGLELDAVMKWYSVGFELFYCSIFFACFYLTKKITIPFSFIIFKILIVKETFFWIQSELPQGLAFLFLYLAFLEFKANNTRSYLDYLLDAMNYLFLFTLSFFHPLLIFPFIYITLYYCINNLYDPKKIINYLLFLTKVFVIKNTLLKSVYDASAFDGIKNFVTLFPNYFTIQSNFDFLGQICANYLLLLLGYLIVNAIWLYQRHLINLLVFNAFFLGYFFLINVTFHQGGNGFYMENLYLPLAAMLVIPIAYEHIHRLKLIVLVILLSVIIPVRFYAIYDAHHPFTKRLKWMQAFMDSTDKLEHKKLIVDQALVPMDLLKMSWGSGFEFWLLSTSQGKPSRSIIIEEDVKQLAWAKSLKQSLVLKWGVYNYKNLHPVYTNFTDTSSYVYYRQDELSQNYQASNRSFYPLE